MIETMLIRLVYEYDESWFEEVGDQFEYMMKHIPVGSTAEELVERMSPIMVVVVTPPIMSVPQTLLDMWVEAAGSQQDLYGDGPTKEMLQRRGVLTHDCPWSEAVLSSCGNTRDDAFDAAHYCGGCSLTRDDTPCWRCRLRKRRS